jgi:hypothetical protein
VRVRRLSAAVPFGGPTVEREHVFGVDALMSEVMQARWRTNALCARMDSFERCSQREQQSLCAVCPVSEPCFWSALVEERAFRHLPKGPPGVRGGVEGARRRFILGELTDVELMNRYRQEVGEYNRVTFGRVATEPRVA